MLVALLLASAALQDRQAGGSWKDGDVPRARITPVCGRQAILEEWAGPLHGRLMNGFSLRAHDPARQDWDLLFWTTDGNGGFGKLRGTFPHGRGEFFSGSGPSLTRYAFSDGLRDSVRWDSATTTDAGVTWKTDWIMEFSRTRAAAEGDWHQRLSVRGFVVQRGAWESHPVSTDDTVIRAASGPGGGRGGLREPGGGRWHQARDPAASLGRDAGDRGGAGRRGNGARFVGVTELRRIREK